MQGMLLDVILKARRKYSGLRLSLPPPFLSEHPSAILEEMTPSFPPSPGEAVPRHIDDEDDHVVSIILSYNPCSNYCRSHQLLEVRRWSGNLCIRFIGSYYGMYIKLAS